MAEVQQAAAFVNDVGHGPDAGEAEDEVDAQRRPFDADAIELLAHRGVVQAVAVGPAAKLVNTVQLGHHHKQRTLLPQHRLVERAALVQFFRQLIEQAVEAELAEFVKQCVDQVLDNERATIVGNGYQSEREI